MSGGVNDKITVITHGRFHSFDMAEQIQDAGRLAAIFTGYPRFKLTNTRVNPALIRSFPWFVTPYMALLRFGWFPRRPLHEWSWQGGEALNRYAARHLPDCGLVTAISGSGRESGFEIHRRGGAYICDRGSTHILWVQRMLDQEYQTLGLAWEDIDPRSIKNERVENDLADAITLPSGFTQRSFIEMGVPESKLHVIPYGVNLAAFQRSTPRVARFRVLFVGQLSVRKGLHYLLDAFNRAQLPNAELVLVGGRSEDTAALLKRHPVGNLVLTGHVSREEVVRQMSLSSVMVLPSLEEGLALVQAQALACGCPVIATPNTGSEDLFEDGREGFIVPVRDAEALTERLVRLYRDRAMAVAMGEAGVVRVKALGGWDTYGRKMIALFDRLMTAKGIPVTNGKIP